MRDLGSAFTIGRMPRLRSEANQASSTDSQPDAAEQPQAASEEHPDSKLSGADDGAAETEPEPKDEGPAPRGRFGTIAAEARCANLQCVLPELPKGNIVFSFSHTFLGKAQRYLPGQTCCADCAAALHSAAARRWQHFRTGLTQSYPVSKIDSLAKGRGGAHRYNAGARG